jgi:hypothetical protein
MSYQEMNQLFKTNSIDSQNQAVLFGVRAVTTNGNSQWSSGIYTTGSQINSSLDAGFATWLGCAMRHGTWDAANSVCIG